MWMLFIIFAFSIYYHATYNINYSDASLISIKQVIKPFSLLYDSGQQEFLGKAIYQGKQLIHLPLSTYLMSMIESIITSLLLFLFALAIRWNFRRA